MAGPSAADRTTFRPGPKSLAHDGVRDPRATPYGQGAGTLEHMGSEMTYFWLEPRRDDPLTGFFLSQRQPNIAVNRNLANGMHVIFGVFVPLVSH
jgi:hypothetical protein